MIMKVTGYSNEEPKYYRLFDSKGNKIEDEHSQLMITNILKGIQYTMNVISKEMDSELDGFYDIGFFYIEDKIKNYKKILEQIDFHIEFKEINQEEVIEF